MVKFGKNKLKAIKKLTKKQNVVSPSVSTNKVNKKKLNTEKKVTFQKEILLREAAESPLVKKLSTDEILLNKLASNQKVESKLKKEGTPKPKKIKSVEKQKKRHKTQISDTKMLLNLMKKSK